MKRRDLLATAAIAALASLAPSVAWAGSYLDRAALLLVETQREGDLVQPRVGDKEFVAIVAATTAARLDAARGMQVPAQVAKAHPHLLLVLTNADAAMRAAVEGDFKKFMQSLTAARAEDKNFRLVLKTLGYTLPEHGSRR